MGVISPRERMAGLSPNEIVAKERKRMAGVRKKPQRNTVGNKS